jgi:hypothetical protein
MAQHTLASAASLLKTALKHANAYNLYFYTAGHTSPSVHFVLCRRSQGRGYRVIVTQPQEHPEKPTPPECERLGGAVFPETTPPTTGGRKRPAERGASEGTKSKPAPNQNPHQSLALTSNAKWDKVRRSIYVIPKAGGVDVCGQYHCR